MTDAVVANYFLTDEESLPVVGSTLFVVRTVSVGVRVDVRSIIELIVI